MLYLDLYGNDEGDNEQPQEENETSAEQLAAEAPMKAEVPEVSLKPAAEKPHTNGTQVPTPMTANGAPQQTTYVQQAPQQIPTYEQPLQNDYREAPAPRTDGGYQNIAGGERSVRPSEMKDEG